MKLLQSSLTPVVTLTYVNAGLELLYFNPAVSVTIDERGLNKYARDDVNSIDLISIGINKGLVDNQPAIDLIQSFTLGKGLSDDNSTQDELHFSIGFLRDYTDDGYVSDAIASFAIGKGLIDSSVASDRIQSLGVSKSLTDEILTFDMADINAGDGLEYAFGKGINDTPVVTSDASYATVIKALTESLLMSDAVNQMVIDKVLSDTSISNDILTSDITKPIADSYTSTDLFDRVFDSIRDFTETLSGADSINSFAIGKALSESASSTEAGSLLMTDYADITYFAEDYVGSSRTF
jgi:hypothetical protein